MGEMTADNVPPPMGTEKHQKYFFLYRMRTLESYRDAFGMCYLRTSRELPSRMDTISKKWRYKW